jgi:hypothetical protein
MSSEHTPSNEETLKALQSMHLVACSDQCIPFDPTNASNPRFQVLQISLKNMIACLHSFPQVSAGGCDDIILQQLQNM